jgi:hypothetical protein
MGRQELKHALAVGLFLVPYGCASLWGGNGASAPPSDAPADSARAEASDSAPSAARASTEEAPLESVSVVVTDEERRRLLEEAVQDLERVAELCRDVNESRMSTEDRDTLRAIERLVGSAKEALGQDDPVAAASLSHKARLLAIELFEG